MALQMGIVFRPVLPILREKLCQKRVHFIHFAVFPHLIVGHQLSDVVAVLGSLNIIAAELDR